MKFLISVARVLFRVYLLVGWLTLWAMLYLSFASDPTLTMDDARQAAPDAIALYETLTIAEAAIALITLKGRRSRAVISVLFVLTGIRWCPPKNQAIFALLSMSVFFAFTRVLLIIAGNRICFKASRVLHSILQGPLVLLQSKIWLDVALSFLNAPEPDYKYAAFIGLLMVINIVKSVRAMFSCRRQYI